MKVRRHIKLEDQKSKLGIVLGGILNSNQQIKAVFINRCNRSKKAEPPKYRTTSLKKSKQAVNLDSILNEHLAREEQKRERLNHSTRCVSRQCD